MTFQENKWSILKMQSCNVVAHTLKFPKKCFYFNFVRPSFLDNFSDFFPGLWSRSTGSFVGTDQIFDTGTDHRSDHQNDHGTRDQVSGTKV